jgi:protein PhnA
MSLETILSQRSQSKCELCESSEGLGVLEILPLVASSPERSAMLCQTCRDQVEHPEKIDVNHWYCLNQSIWSEVDGVKVLAWRQLNHLLPETWAQDLLDQMYLDDDLMRWAKSGMASSGGEDQSTPTVDSNGAVLEAGDAVTLIKDLVVKGANFTAKRGTMVKGISLTDDPGLIEGRVNGSHIVLKTCFLKKA